jgi:pimeloyl-ACP methyl ester carboxylesterase
VTDAKPLRGIAGFEERWTDARAVRMRYLVAGSGPPLVLVHGWTGAASNFSELAPLLARRFRVLVPDLPGHGGSSPLPAAPNMDAYADRVRDVAAHEGMLPLAVVGHSMGGLVALRLALRRPEEVSVLVLAASAGIESVTRRAEFWIALAGLVRPGRLLSPYRLAIARSPLLRRLVFGRYQVADPDALSERAIDGLLTASGHHTDVVSAGKAIVRDDPRVELEAVRCPTLVLWGARDLQVPVADAFEYARRLRAPVRVIADCGHLLVAERPDACAHAIGEFLDGVEELDELPVEAELPR